MEPKDGGSEMIPRSLTPRPQAGIIPQGTKVQQVEGNEIQLTIFIVS